MKQQLMAVDCDPVKEEIILSFPPNTYRLDYDAALAMASAILAKTIEGQAKSVRSLPPVQASELSGLPRLRPRELNVSRIEKYVVLGARLAPRSLLLLEVDREMAQGILLALSTILNDKEPGSAH